MAQSNAEKSANKRARAAKAGRRLYRGSTELWPTEHELLCLVVDWIKGQRDAEGMPGDLSRVSEVVKR